MDELIQKLGEMTQKLIEDLQNLRFEEINDFVERREQIMLQLQKLQSTSTITDKNREDMKRILQQDEIILARMSELKDEAEKAINKISLGRQQKKGYDHSYSMDGVYFDKKK